VALIIPILSNAITSKEPTAPDAIVPCNCNNSAKGDKDCCNGKGVRNNDCANCANCQKGKNCRTDCANCPKDCPNLKDGKPDCANCPNKDCPKQQPVKKKGSCCPSHEEKK
jgi:hypothetical protein